MRYRRRSNFPIAYLVNLALNFEWSVPAWILLVLHFKLGVPMWCFWTALILWLAVILAHSLFLHWVYNQPDAPSPPKENKNPYSQTGYTPMSERKKQNK